MLVGINKHSGKYLLTAFLLVLSVAFAKAQTAPHFTSSPVTSATYNTTYSYPITAVDDDGDAIEIILSGGPLPNGIILTDNGDGTGTLAGTPLESGSFPVELTVRQTGDPSQNDVQPFTIVVDKASATITLNNLTPTYNGSAQAATATTAPAGLSVSFTYNGSSTVPTNAASYTVVATVNDPNYTGTKSGTLVIGKAALTVTADDASKVYGQANPAFTMHYSGFVGSDGTGSITAPAANTIATTTSGAGTYPITLTGGSAVNYTFTLQSGTLTVTKAALTAKADDQSKTYGQVNPTLTITYTGFLNGDGIGSIAPPSISTTAATGSAAGSYPITVTGGSAANYNITLQNGTMTVSKADLTATANTLLKTYGTANPTLTILYSGFVNGDTPASITQPSISTTATTGSAVGDYPITLSGGSSPNYNITLQNGTLTISKANLTAKADDLSKIYGQANPALTTSYSGFVNGDNVSSITQPSIATSATTSSGTGSYPITLTGGAATNYNITLQSGTLTINKAALTAKADDQTKVYASALPTLTVSYSGFVNGDTPASITAPSISTAATNSSNAGTYPITLTGGNAVNYNLTLQNGTLTISKATITAKADDFTRIYNQPNPALSISYSGFLNGDDVTAITPPTASTAATQTSNVGNYSITLTGGSATNYSFTLQTGTLTISKATPTVTWGNPSDITYGTPLSATQLNATASVPGSFVYTPASGAILSAGANQTLSVNFNPTDATNYNSVTGTAVLISVNKATPTVTWSSPAAIVYGTALSATQLNATASVPGTFSYAPGVGTILNAGANQALSVNFTPTDGANYNPVNGTQVLITVNKATPVITWSNPATITYGTPLTSVQLNATSNVPGSFNYSPSAGTVLNAGANQILNVSFTPAASNNYNPVSNVQVQITVNKATPIITWPVLSPITYGTPLSATQLCATTTVPGTYSYAPALGTVLPAGSQTLLLNFTPTDGTNYNSVPGVLHSLTITKADPVVTWNSPSPITYGTALSSAQLNATATVPGTFTYTPPSGTVLTTGVNQTLSVNFSPTDANNYNPVNNVTVQITVNKATPVVTWPAPLPIKVGVALSGTQLNATASVPGSFTYTPPSGTVLPTGANQVLSVNFTPSDGTNYNSVNNVQVLITVSAKDNPNITWNAPAAINYGTALSATQLNATADVPGTFVYTPAAGTILNAGANQTLSLNFIPTDGVNYNSINASTQITVNKGTLTATAVSTSRIYGAANPSFAINYTGFVNSETASVIDTQPTAASSAVAGSSAGSTFPIVPSGGVDNNYNFTYVNGVLTINKAPLTAKADDKSRSYGLANPTFTISYTGFVNGDDKTSIAEPTIATAATAASNVGTYPITLSGGSAANYNLTLQSGTLTINISPLTIRADDKSKTYAQANPALTITYSGFLNGDSPSSITQPSISTTAVTGSDAGTYPITLTGGSALNYGIILQNGTMTVIKASLTIKADDKSKIYGQPNPTLTTSYSGFVNGDDATDITPPTISTPAMPGSNAGTYPISLAGGSATNYDFTLQNGTLTISKATPVVTWANQAPITYGTPLSSAQLNATATVPGTFTYTPGIGAILNAGANQSLSVNFSPSDLTNYNTVNGTTVQITVTKATPVITWANPAPITYGTALGASQLNATATTTGTFVYTPAAGTLLNAGANQILSVNFTPTDGANYNPVSGTTVLTTVNKATPVITWNNPAAITYGTALSGTQLNATSTVPGTFTYTPPGGTVLNAGANQTLSVNFVPTNTTNYNSVSNTTVSITVNKATPVVTWSNPAPIVYGTALSATQLNASVGITGTFTYSPSIGTILNAGANQPLTVSFTPTDVANYNSVSGVQVLITVNKATPVITWPTPATITYGTPLSATQLNATASVPGSFTYTPASGAVLNTGVNQNLSVNFTPTDAANYNAVTNVTRQITVIKATPTVTWATPLPIKVGVPLNGTQLNATASVPGTFTYTPPSGTTYGTQGTYTLSVNFTPTDAANYNSVNNTTVQITVSLKDNPVITWSNPADITYGTALSASQLNATANVPGSFAYSPALGTVLDAGGNQTLTTTFTPTDAINYNSIIATVHIDVNQAILTATAVSTSRAYGASNPTFAISYSGFVNGDTQAQINTLPTASCSAIVGSPAGSTFPITLSGGVDSNYSFNYVNGTLTINKAALTAKADDKSRSYGLVNPAFTISYTGFVNGDDPTDVTSPIASTTASLTSNVGTYPITLSGGSATNYSLSYVAGTLTVTIAPLTAKADNKSRTYGAANPTLTITYTGFLNSDNPSSITEPTISTAATPATPVGTYAITLSGGSAQNYGLILQPGTLTIGKASLTAKADDKSKTYGQVNPANSITYTGFMNGDNASSVTPPTISGPAATTGSPVGTYPITLSGGSATNYNLTLQNGLLTINKANLRITVQDKSRMYSQQNPPLTFSYVMGDFVNGDTPSTITAPVATTTATTASPSGTYPITVTGTTLNYTFVVSNGTLTVTKAPLTAKADDKSKNYGDPVPLLTVTISGFVNGEDQSQLSNFPVASTTATAASPAGSYPITVSGGSASNYTFNYVSGALNVGKVQLTVKADNQSKPFQTPNPPLTISYSGFVNGEALSVIDVPPTASTTATTNSPVGGYPITVSGGSDDNYSFLFVPGTLLVVSSFPPTLKDSTITTKEDTRIELTIDLFKKLFVGDAMQSIKIKTIPSNGTIRWKGNQVSAGDIILIENGSIVDLGYIPGSDFNGTDLFTWNAFDGIFYATVDAKLTIKIDPINDAPVLNNIEPDAILYELGDPAIAVTDKVLVNDIDSDDMIGARITVTDGHRAGDLLALSGDNGTIIKPSFDATKGELVLSGKDSRANYQAALRNVVFSSPISSDTTKVTKKISLVVTDGSEVDSNPVSRTIEITKVFPELSMVSAFTPNNDGVNDEWDFLNLQYYSAIKIAVFDQNGNRVYDCGNKNCRWDGKFNGKELPAGPYLYSIELDDGKRTYHGTVTILK